MLGVCKCGHCSSYDFTGTEDQEPKVVQGEELQNNQARGDQGLDDP